MRGKTVLLLLIVHHAMLLSGKFQVTRQNRHVWRNNVGYQYGRLNFFTKPDAKPESGGLPTPAGLQIDDRHHCAAADRAGCDDEPGGCGHLAPFSFYSGVGSNPPTVLFCPALRSTEPADGDLRKDTLRNVEETGEFVINVVSEEMAAGANLSSTDVPPDVDEFPLSGLTPAPSEAVRPFRVAESPAQMECKLLQVIYTGHEPRSGVIVLGQIVRFHIREDLVEDLRVDQAGLNAVGRMAGHSWVRTRDRFEMTLPK
jgi:flavin reductase (DIM6/NTAB) family NADH-FMN oxidoreductase RutF